MTIPMNILTSRGVYFLANNTVFEQVVAFLRSFRTHNPDIPLCLIPYNDDVDRITALSHAYSFSILVNPALMRECDSIGENFHGKVLGTYRKLAAWEGIFESFIYIDVDTVVTGPINFAFEQLAHGDYIASHSDIENIRCWVWKDNVYATHLLTAPQIAFAANTGFFVSRRGIFPIEHCRAKVQGALQLKDSMELGCMEQPFLNYLVVTSGYKYTSLLKLLKSGTSAEACVEWWAGTPGGPVDNGKIIHPDGSHVFLVHWAGIWQQKDSSSAEFPYKDLWEFYRRPGTPPDVF